MSGKHLEFLRDRLALHVLLIVVSIVFPDKAGVYLNTQGRGREGRVEGRTSQRVHPLGRPAGQSSELQDWGRGQGLSLGVGYGNFCVFKHPHPLAPCSTCVDTMSPTNWSVLVTGALRREIS